MTTQNEKSLRQIMVWGSAIGAGFGAGSLAALQPQLNFAFSYKPVVAFILATGLVYFYWKLIFRAMEDPSLKTKRTVATVLMCLLGVVALLYPIRFIAPHKYGEVLTGLAMAAVALSMVAALLVLTMRFFNEN